MFIFPGMGSSKLIAIKPRNHLETQTSAYTLVAFGERARVQTLKVTVYLHSMGLRTGTGLGRAAKGPRHCGNFEKLAGAVTEPLGCCLVGTKAACVGVLEAGHGPSVRLGTGTQASPDGRPCTWGQPAWLLFQSEQSWQRKWSRWWGHQVLSNQSGQGVAGKGGGASPGSEETPTMPARNRGPEGWRLILSPGKAAPASPWHVGDLPPSPGKAAWAQEGVQLGFGNTVGTGW